ncbi:MAG: hypothetical protein D6770_08900 [Anaerolineae bacterium]|nr:MAG: hypothetical protein D6770_08900 [Anaerolineae bacterium]
MDFTRLALVAFFVEAIVQTIKPLYDPEKGWNRNVLLALAGGIIVCVLTGVDLFAQLGLAIPIPYVGSVLTGIIASRGSNVVHDVFKFVEQSAHPDSGLGAVG